MSTEPEGPAPEASRPAGRLDRGRGALAAPKTVRRTVRSRCTAKSSAVIDRVRGRLADAQHGGTVPPFTVSFGIAPGEADLTFGQVVEEADALLLRAKAEGRDRVVVAGKHQDASKPESSGDADAELRPIA